MNILSRIAKLEKKASRTKGYGIYDANGVEVQAEVISKPTPEVDGLARLPDGTEIAIVYDYGLEIKVAGEPEVEKDEGKLYYRQRPGAEMDPKNMRIKLPHGLTMEDL